MQKQNLKKLSRILVSYLLLASIGNYSYAVPRGVPPVLTATFLDTGDSRRPFTVAIGSTTPVQIFPSSAAAQGNFSFADREIHIQNITPFRLFCSTFATVSATAGNRFLVVSSETYKAYTITPLWCIFEPSAGAGTKEVIGEFLYDSRD